MDLSLLNEQQEDALLDSFDADTLVMAGAGSGKTRLLVYRVAFIVDMLKKDPEEIMLVTFTNKAANEMKRRIEELGVDTEAMWCGTFHAVCVRILKKYGSRIGLPKFSIMDTYSSKKLIGDSLVALGQECSKENVNRMMSKISCFKNNMVRPDSAISNASNYDDEMDARVYKYYQDTAFKKKQLDFDDLITYTTVLLHTSEQTRRWFHDNIKYILVDETQDSNRAQYVLLKLLKGPDTNLFLVGDGDQCFPGDTKVLTSEGYKNISDINVGDHTISACGNAEVTKGYVERVSKKEYKGPLVKITTESGKIIKATPNHIVFGRIEPNEDVHYVYLMQKKGFGFRIGRTRGVRSTGKELVNGFSVRLTQENADKLWIIHQCDDLEEAVLMEAYYSYKYGIPQYIFKSSGTGATLPKEKVIELYSMIDTEKRALQLLSDKHMFIDYPHHIPQAYTNKSTRFSRNKLNFVMFGANRKCSLGYMSELSFNTINEDYALIGGKYMGVSKKHTNAKTIYHNGRNISSVYDDVWNTMETFYKDCLDNGIDVNLSMRAKLTDNKFDFQPIVNILPGTIIPVEKDGFIIEEKVVSVELENYEGYVFDINVCGYRNYIAEGICVHNSIYGFRNAKPEYLVNFNTTFPGSKIKKLEQNYRSTKVIVNASNGVIQNNSFRIDKVNFTDNPMGQRIMIKNCINPNEEALWIANIIAYAVSSGKGKYSDYAVLYRSNAQSRAIEEAMLNMQVPYNITGGTKFYSRKEIMDVLAYFKLRANPNDSDSFKRIMKMQKGIGDKTIEGIVTVADSNNIDYITMMDVCSEPKKIKPTLNRLYNLLTSSMTSLYSFANDVIKSNNIIGKYQKEGTEEALGRIENIQELLNIINDFPGGLEDFMDYIALYSNDDRDTGDSDKVSLMTIHASKGLEFNSVFLPGVEEGLLPHANSRAADEVEEERRIMYVAMTRARHRLYISHCDTRKSFTSKNIYANPSRFIGEIPQEYVQEI